jgi:hypothetical protein
MLVVDEEAVVVEAIDNGVHNPFYWEIWWRDLAPSKRLTRLIIVRYLNWLEL